MLDLAVKWLLKKVRNKRIASSFIIIMWRK